VTVGSVSFNRSGLETSVIIANDRAENVALAGSRTFATDDVGSVYPLVPLADSPQLVVEAGTTVEATLGFSGRIDDEATELSVVFNVDGSQTDPDTRQPSFAFGPYELVRGEGPVEPVTAQVFPVGDRTQLVPADLVVSQVDRITETLREFDAEEVDGGFRLTLPDSILFDFGSSELRVDAAPTLSLIAEVLVFYSDADVIVVGHTDSIGSDQANQSLSEERAQSVVDVLVSDHGIAVDRLAAEGRGESEPVAENTNPDGSDNPEGRQLNRRVEIVVLTDEPVELP
jgi:outer membrane protein OmpA-like peptidoglycan-associated protein